jgi:hypothetical protein
MSVDDEITAFFMEAALIQAVIHTGAHPDCPCKPGKCIYPECTCAIPPAVLDTPTGGAE